MFLWWCVWDQQFGFRAFDHHTSCYWCHYCGLNFSDYHQWTVAAQSSPLLSPFTISVYVMDNFHAMYSGLSCQHMATAASWIYPSPIAPIPTPVPYPPLACWIQSSLNAISTTKESPNNFVHIYEKFCNNQAPRYSTFSKTHTHSSPDNFLKKFNDLQNMNTSHLQS